VYGVVYPHGWSGVGGHVDVVVALGYGSGSLVRPSVSGLCGGNRRARATFAGVHVLQAAAAERGGPGDQGPVVAHCHLDVYLLVSCAVCSCVCCVNGEAGRVAVSLSHAVRSP
jgi:hypothetical protein